MEDYLLPCLNKKLFGFDCPGCGMQRAFLHLMNGDLSKAFQLFPAIYTSLLLFMLIGLHLMDKTHNYQKLVVAAAIANAVVVIIAYICKMI